MKDILQYKDFIGSVHFNSADEIFFGKIEGIDDLVSFEGTTVTEIKEAFEEAVNDYIALCEENNKKLEKSYKGSFNVRLSSEMHKKAKLLSVMQGISLNQFVQKAIQQAVLNASLTN